MVQHDWKKHFAEGMSCQQCWYGYPKPCSCGGLVHAEYVGSSKAIVLACDTQQGDCGVPTGATMAIDPDFPDGVLLMA